MRILGMSQMWPKLDNPSFTSFRFARRDRDWAVGEMVSVVFRPRSKDRRVLGMAEIVGKVARCMAPHIGCDLPFLTDAEAQYDGFESSAKMQQWLVSIYGGHSSAHMNKLTLKWRERAVQEVPK